MKISFTLRRFFLILEDNRDFCGLVFGLGELLSCVHTTQTINDVLRAGDQTALEWSSSFGLPGSCSNSGLPSFPFFASGESAIV